MNRTVGMPGAMDDIGNWIEPLRLLSVINEGTVVWIGLAGWRSMQLGTVDERALAPDSSSA